MPRRHLLPLLTAAALLLLAAPVAVAAAPAATGPAARTAIDEEPGAACAEGELAVEEQDGTITCSSDDELADGDDVEALCDDWSATDDDWSEDDAEWSDDEAELASASAEEEDCADWEDESAGPARVSKLKATAAGSGRRLTLTISYALDAAGEVALTLERTEVGVTSGRRCVAAAKRAGAGAGASKGRRGGKRCNRATPVRGTVADAGEAGANRLVLRRWKGARLAPGSYRLTAFPAQDDSGKPAVASFRVAPPAIR